MSLTEQLKKKSEQIPQYISVSEIPPKIEVKILSFEFKTDKRGNEACFITLVTKDGKRVVQKYTKSCYEALFNAIEHAGGERYLSENFHVWVQERRGRSINPRLYPTPIEKPKK